jgi:tRNA-splicing ligase RtcB (3'-phosphate/5'-hydroxy nucleic acid ligase)
MKKRDLEKAGIPRGPVMDIALQASIAALRSGLNKREVLSYIRSVVEQPRRLKDDPLFRELAQKLAGLNERPEHSAKTRKAPFKIWGTKIDKEAIAQLERACSLPVAIRGALMPDAHVGYGLPIGGVLAVRNAVIPYAVGVDIACRMKMTVLDIPAASLREDPSRFKEALARETLFGVGAAFRKKHDHPVMDRDWSFSPVTAENKDLAWGQLGTSGSGNHFAEFGTLTVERNDAPLKPGVYTALLSHSGSRGTGSKVAGYYSQIAMQKHRELSPDFRHLAWLDCSSAEGIAYWSAMELMGAYAAANHEIIHQKIVRHLGASVLWDIENHHNFAWKENHDEQELVVHRKGATPAAKDTLGVIPGSMASPGFVVRGKGSVDSLNSASHGAGRCLSRSAARKQFHWNEVRGFLDAAGVTLISAGIDEAPMAYKDIREIMTAQSDLVEIIARFDPAIVKMAPGSECAED